MVVNNLPALLIYKGVKLEHKVTPVVKTQKDSKYNKNNRRPDEQKKRNVKATAAVLRISEQGKSKTGID
jgi:hypothetical protein